MGSSFCVNIGQREKTKRLVVAIVMYVAAMLIGMMIVGQGHPWYVLGVLIIPIFVGTLGAWQAEQSCCVYLAMKGKTHLDNGVGDVSDAWQKEELLKRSRLMICGSAFVTMIIVSMCCLLYVYWGMIPKSYLTQGIFLVNVIATWMMCGVIWLVQVAHYPLFAKIGSESFADYHRRHVWLVTSVVGPPMVLEAITAILLLWYPPAGLAMSTIWLGIALVFVIWLSTIFFQVPQHDKLSKQFDAKVHRFLVRSNWIRTIAWTARGVLVGYWVVIRVV